MTDFPITVPVQMPDGVRQWPAHYETYSVIPGDFFGPSRLVPDHIPGHRVEELVGGAWVAYRVGGE